MRDLLPPQDWIDARSRLRTAVTDRAHMTHRYGRQSPYNPPSSEGDLHLSWTIWWDMHRRAGGQGWSRAMESSEEAALQRADRFLKLGFVVYAIRSPMGAVFMDEAQIAGHFVARERLLSASLDLGKPQR
jgi:hypothetical protein